VFQPKTFLEAIGGISALLAVFFLFLSLRSSLRAHAMRLSAMLTISAIAFIANHWVIYFSAVFIIATAATELEFLQNLAAIVRGNKDYFNYRKALIRNDYLEARSSPIISSAESLEAPDHGRESKR
jgi:hypothetical protein